MRIGSIQHHLKLLCLTLALALMVAWAWPSELPAAPEKKSGAKKTAAKKKSSSKGAQKALPWPQNLLTLVGDGAVLVVDHHASQGAPKELYAHNAEKLYVPASILKIVTSGAALDYLGPDYRFKTDFLLTRDGDLWIVGYGDPYLVSEELVLIVEALQKRGLKEIRDIYIDTSYFEKDLILDGNTQTLSPYDAYNSAFGVNFNTITFRKNKKGQILRVAEKFPLTPLAQERAAKSKRQGTVTENINDSPALAEVHAGQMFKAHLEDAGITVKGEIFTDQKAPERRRVYYRHESSKPLNEVLTLLMKYSNNFMTNQIFLAMGAELYGAPATLEKSQQAMEAYFKKYRLPSIVMGDGSGLSRGTVLTARQMACVLEVVESDRRLFTSRDDGQVFCKTGTMSDIKTLAGFIERPGEPDKPLSFVILLNGNNYPPGVRDKILDILKTQFAPKGSPPPSAGK